MYKRTNFVWTDADSAGTWEFLCTNANHVLSGVVPTGNHLYSGELLALLSLMLHLRLPEWECPWNVQS